MRKVIELLVKTNRSTIMPKILLLRNAPSECCFEMLFGKVVSKIGAQNTLETMLLKHDVIKTLVNKKFENFSQKTFGNRIRKKTVTMSPSQKCVEKRFS